MIEWIWGSSFDAESCISVCFLKLASRAWACMETVQHPGSPPWANTLQGREVNSQENWMDSSPMWGERPPLKHWPHAARLRMELVAFWLVRIRWNHYPVCIVCGKKNVTSHMPCGVAKIKKKTTQKPATLNSRVTPGSGRCPSCQLSMRPLGAEQGWLRGEPRLLLSHIQCRITQQMLVEWKAPTEMFLFTFSFG